MQSTGILIEAIAQPTGAGQKVHWLKLAYQRPIAASELTNALFEVEHRCIKMLYVNDSGKQSDVQSAGRYVFVELDMQDAEGATFEIKHDVEHGRIAMRDVVAHIRQTQELHAVDGSVYPAWDAPRPVTIYTEPVAEKFRQYSWQDPVTRQWMNYHLYVPQKLVAGKRYPLVLFIHDAGACSQEMAAALAQGLGGTVWAQKAEQAKHPCFVLVPCYPRPIVDDDWSETWEVEATRRLLMHVAAQWPIRRDRLYATGQSMGCMTLCALNARYPSLFAASLLIAGQWDPQVTGAMKDCRIWVLISEQDEKAFPGMQEVARSIERAGGTAQWYSWDATAAMETQNRIIQQIAEKREKSVFTYFQTDSVLRVEPKGGHPHPKTWCWAYQLEALRDWLFQE
jgi:predicted peptidase